MPIKTLSLLLGLRKPRVLIFGATGMLGSAVTRALKDSCDLTTPSSTDVDLTSEHLDFGPVTKMIKSSDYAIYCAGKTNRDDTRGMGLINTWTPSDLAEISEENGAKFIYISTDCVFLPTQQGPFNEESAVSLSRRPSDHYQWTKAHGEIYTLTAGAMVLRTSIIGPEEKGRSRNLLTWFLGHPEGSTVDGYENHLWSGVTTLELARIIRDQIIFKPFGFSKGKLFHVCQPAVKYSWADEEQGFVTKAGLLNALAAAFKRDITINFTVGPDGLVDRRLTTVYPKKFKVRPLAEQLWELRNHCDSATGTWKN